MIQIIFICCFVFKLYSESVINLSVASNMPQSSVYIHVIKVSIRPHASVEVEKFIKILTKAVIILYFDIVS